LSKPRISDNIPVIRTTVSDSLISLFFADSTIGWNCFRPAEILEEMRAGIVAIILRFEVNRNKYSYAIFIKY
jgi:hypothetical protein